MAQLKWNQVDAPRIDLRDTMLAGQNITQSFDRMGQMLMDREKMMRQRATDEVVAQGLAQTDVEGLQQFIQNVPGQAAGNRRVSSREVLEALNPRVAALQEQWIKQDDIFNRQAEVQFAGDLDTLGGLGYSGDTAGYAARRDTIDDTDLGRRALFRGREYLAGRHDTGFDDRLDTTKATDQRNYQQGSLDVQNRELSLRQQVANERRALLEQERIGWADAQKLMSSSDFAGTTDDFMSTLMQRGFFEGKSREYVQAFGSAITDPNLGRDRRLTPTQSQVAALPDLQVLSGVVDTAQRLEQIKGNRFDAENMPSTVIRRAEELGDVKPETFYAAAAERGIRREDAERIRTENPGIGYNHLLAAIESDGSIADADFWSRKNALSTDLSEYYHGGERALGRISKTVSDLLLNQGDLARATNERALAVSEAQQAQTAAQALADAMRREVAQGTPEATVQAKYASDIAALKVRVDAQMEALRQAAEKKRGEDK